MGTGTLQDPFTLAQAMSNGSVHAGDTIWLRGGTYSGNFTCLLPGWASKPITIRSYPGEWAVIDGTITLGYSDGSRGGIVLRDLEIKNSNTDRGSLSVPPGDNYRAPSLTNYGPYNKIINCIIHDGGVSVGDWSAGYNAELYGCLIYNGGWQSSARGNGHAWYVQNNVGIKTGKHNLMMPHMGRTLAGYGSGASSGLRISENVFMEETGGNALLGASGRMTDIQFINNHILGGLAAQYTHTQNGSLIATGNTLWQSSDMWSFLVGYWEILTITGNKLCGKSPLDDVVIKESWRWTPPDDTTGMSNTWNTNEYYYKGAEEKPYKHNGLYKTFAEWQAAGFDAAGSYDTSNPAWNVATYYPNEYADDYDTRLGIAVIWNWAGANTVSLPINGTPDTQVKVRNALDYFGDIQTLTVDAGGAVTVNMQAINRTIAKPTGWDVALVDTPFPTFGAFVIETA